MKKHLKIIKAIKRHKTLMEKYILWGMSKKEASEKAHNEINKNNLKKALLKKDKSGLLQAALNSGKLIIVE